MACHTHAHSEGEHTLFVLSFRKKERKKESALAPASLRLLVGDHEGVEPKARREGEGHLALGPEHAADVPVHQVHCAPHAAERLRARGSGLRAGARGAGAV